MVETEFIKGKWYKYLLYNNEYRKCSESAPNVLFYSESIENGKHNYKNNNANYRITDKDIRIVNLLEITPFLPSGHPDLEQNILQSLEIW